MDEELVLVSGVADPGSCAVIKEDDPTRIEWTCARIAQCSRGSYCTAGLYKVWIKQSDMTRYLALRLVS